MQKLIPVLEIFGPTIQGEGAVIGVKTMFIRTAGCDYSCDWCDSSFTWDGSGKEYIKMMTSEHILKKVKEIGGDNFSHVTISGGNPVLLPQMGDLVHLLKIHRYRIAIETQGSKWQDWLYSIDDITISPKPPSSGMRTNYEKLSEIIRKLDNRENVNLKVVVFNDEDFSYAKNIHTLYPSVPFYLQVGNGYVNTKDNDKLIPYLLKKYQWLIEKTLNCKEMNDSKVLPQLHTLVWGNKRGV